MRKDGSTSRSDRTLERLATAPGHAHPVNYRPGNGRRHETTERVRKAAVLAAISQMHDQLGEPQELRDFARAALMSPFHFHRVFRTVTASTPGRFLTALRMSQAKRLLLETDLSATEISITVGYSSFGTFTTQFTKLVGVSPGRFRARAAALADLKVSELLTAYQPNSRALRRGARGWVGRRPDNTPGVAVVGLFPSRIPQEPPMACAVVEPPAPVLLPELRDACRGEVLAITVAADATVRQVLTSSPQAGIFVGVAAEPVELGAAMPPKPFWIQLRPLRVTDPPLITAFPLLAPLPADERSNRAATS